MNIFEDLITRSRILPLATKECLSINPDKDIRRVERPYFIIPISIPHGSNTWKDCSDRNYSYLYVKSIILMVVAVAK
jgi:hypothetical protein